jgi:hypothetical protein
VGGSPRDKKNRTRDRQRADQQHGNNSRIALQTAPKLTFSVLPQGPISSYGGEGQIEVNSTRVASRESRADLASERKQNHETDPEHSARPIGPSPHQDPMTLKFHSVCLVAASALSASCARYGPFHGNTPAHPEKSVGGPADSRYKMAFIEFGDKGSAVDTSERGAAMNVIRRAQHPLLFAYIHGWLNDADSRDVCRFEHFLDLVSSFPEVKTRKVNVIGAYIAWRERTLPFRVSTCLPSGAEKGRGAKSQHKTAALLGTGHRGARPTKASASLRPNGTFLWRIN